MSPATTAIQKFEGISDQQWQSWERQAVVLAKSNLVPAAYKDNPDDILAVALTAQTLGMELSPTTLGHFHVIEGKVGLSAQLMVALAAREHHELWFEESDDRRATACIVRWGSSRVQKFTYTIEMAMRAGLLDRVVEKWKKEGQKWRLEARFGVDPLQEGYDDVADAPDWVLQQIKAGRIKQKENWHRYPEAMLMARAATRAVRAACPDVLLGLAGSVPNLELPEEPPEDTGPDGPQPPPDADDEIVDAELVDKDAQPEPGDGDTAGGKPNGDVDEQAEEATTEAPTAPPQAEQERGPAPGDSEPTSSRENAVAAPETTPAQPSDLASEKERSAIQARIDKLPDEYRPALLSKWRDAEWGSLLADHANPLRKEHLKPVGAVLDQIEKAAKGEWDRRRKHANAVMGEIGVKADGDRHAFVRDATHDETDSTGRLTEAQLEAVIALVEERKAEIAKDEAEAALAGDAEQPAEGDGGGGESDAAPAAEPDYGPGEEPF